MSTTMPPGKIFLFKFLYILTVPDMQWNLVPSFWSRVGQRFSIQFNSWFRNVSICWVPDLKFVLVDFVNRFDIIFVEFIFKGFVNKYSLFVCNLILKFHPFKFLKKVLTWCVIDFPPNNTCRLNTRFLNNRFEKYPCPSSHYVVIK